MENLIYKAIVKDILSQIHLKNFGLPEKDGEKIIEGYKLAMKDLEEAKRKFIEGI